MIWQLSGPRDYPPGLVCDARLLAAALVCVDAKFHQKKACSARQSSGKSYQKESVLAAQRGKHPASPFGPAPLFAVKAVDEGVGAVGEQVRRGQRDGLGGGFGGGGGLGLVVFDDDLAHVGGHG